MNEGKKGATNNHLTCDVCKIDFNSNADFALHEFSKKHCDNLIRLAKQKPVVSKQKVKSEIPQVEKEQPKVNSIRHAGSFAKYGYFVPGEIYVHSEVSREFNTDYDPYLQKFAENPFKEKPSIQPQNETTSFDPITGFSKKKKKKIKTCQVCNMTLLTLPEYEAHMKSPQHIWKLKMTGMGVSAHFVKASTDLHTTDISEESCKPNIEEEEETTSDSANQDSSSSGPFPLLYCSDCELLLNSPQQYNSHVNGKLHSECALRKAELKAKKEKLENPMPNQLYCYSCKISLNNVFQYNEHKNGKKHKTRCMSLVRKGITIPPEERVPGIPHPNPNRPVVYPELYKKVVLEKQNEESKNPSGGANSEVNNLNCFGASSQGEMSPGTPVVVHCQSESETTIQGSSETFEKSVEGATKCFDSGIQGESGITPGISQTEAESNSTIEDSPAEEGNSVPQVQVPLREEPMAETDDFSKSPAVAETQMETNLKEETKTQISIVADDSPVYCSVCDEKFHWQAQLDSHLATEAHLEKILELKQSGKSESDILKVVYSDRNTVKPNDVGELSCGICNVTTGNAAEFDQHLSSIVHKYTEKDYRKKRALEVKQMVARNEKGEYFCKSCQEGWTSLVDYSQHLHFIKHKTTQKAQRNKLVSAMRKASCLQKQRLMQSLRRRNLPLRKTEKNPGVRTKVSGVATDLHMGNQAPVPSLEPLEPQIDVARNVSIGISDPATADSSNNSNDEETKPPKPKKRNHNQRPNRKLPDGVRGIRGRRPFFPSAGAIPPLMSRPPYPPFPRPGFIPPSRNWPPFSSPRPPPAFGPFREAPMGNPYFRPQRFLRPPWPRNRLPYHRF